MKPNVSYKTKSAMKNPERRRVKMGERDEKMNHDNHGHHDQSEKRHKRPENERGGNPNLFDYTPKPPATVEYE